MEIALEEKQSKSEYNKDYWIKNKERMKESHKKWLEAHPNYWHEYYLKNKEHMMYTQQIWREQNAIDSIYCFVNNKGQVLYWGSSARFQERISSHCTANSHLKMSAEEMVSKWNLDKILYQDYSEYNLSRNDLFYIERYYKLVENELMKTSEVHFQEEKLTRSKEELELLANSLEFIEFNKLERYLN